MAKGTLPTAIMVLGTPGTGKTAIASHLDRILNEKKIKTSLISFDSFRKKLAPKDMNPFTHDDKVRKIIYDRAAQEFHNYLKEGLTLIIDCGLTNESIRRQLKSSIPTMKICHVYCPLIVAMYRETKRSIIKEKHENGHYLYLRALLSLLNRGKSEKIAIPPITHKFDYPECADLHISSFLKSPEKIANKIIEDLKL